MPDAVARDLLQAAPGPEPGAAAANGEAATAAGEALFNPFGTLGVVVRADAAPHPPPPDASALGAVIVLLVAAVAVVRLLRGVLE